MTKADRDAANAKVAAELGRLNRFRMARGVCRHCGGAVPCWSSMFGDAEVGRRWSELSATEFKRLRAKARSAHKGESE